MYLEILYIYGFFKTQLSDQILIKRDPLSEKPTYLHNSVIGMFHHLFDFPHCYNGK